MTTSIYIQTYTSRGYTDWLKVLDDDSTDICQDIPILETVNVLIPEDSIPLFYFLNEEEHSTLFLSGLLSHQKYGSHRAYHKIIIQIYDKSLLPILLAFIHSYLSLSPFDIFDHNTQSISIADEVSRCFDLNDNGNIEKIKFDQAKLIEILNSYYNKIEKPKDRIKINHDIVRDSQENRDLMMAHLLNNNNLKKGEYGSYVLCQSASLEVLKNYKIDWGISNNNSITQQHFITSENKERIPDPPKDLELLTKNRYKNYYWIGALLALVGLIIYIYKTLKEK